MDWERDWPEAIDPETGEDPDGVVHPVPEPHPRWGYGPHPPWGEATGDWTYDPQ